MIQQYNTSFYFTSKYVEDRNYCGAVLLAA